MAKCDQGYLCTVCQEEVKRIDQSEVYLRFVLGWIDAEGLDSQPERHLLCNPTMAQFIVDPDFPEVMIEGPMSKSELDHAYQQQRQQEISEGYRRLKYLQKHRRNYGIRQYPLDRVIQAQQSKK